MHYKKEYIVKSDGEDLTSLLSGKPIPSGPKYSPARTYETHPGAKYSETSYYCRFVFSFLTSI